MKRNILSLCLIATLLLSLCSGVAIPAHAGPIELPMIPGDTSTIPAGLKYTTSNSKVTITAYTGSAKSLTIPSKINGYPVVSIGNSAFEDCSSLTNITIPGSVTSIGEFAFAGCRNLTGITIPGSVISIGSGAFNHCTNLAGIQVNADNIFYSCDENGVLFNKNHTVLIQAPGAISGDYTIPESVTAIAEWAFIACNGLTSIIFKNNAPTIDATSFTSVITTAYYPADNNTWTEDIMLSYGGDIIWISRDSNIPGDLDGDACVDNKDVELLLWFTLFPNDYPITVDADFNRDNIIDNQDVESLLWYTLFPEDYPLPLK